MSKLFLPLWVLGSVFLFLYSYTQVDLSLTLSRASFFQTIEKSFQYVGWFNRSLSSLLFVLVFAFLFSLFTWTLWMVKNNKIPQKTIWLTITLVTIVLFFTYNAFSYDLFNYIFDAKIVTHYYQNPYFHKALDFTGDPMLSFMHWTHRTYPYGPLWLVITVPLSFVGRNIFIITFFLFKALMAVSYFLTAKYIYKIAKILDFKNPMGAVIFFALNPLVITESLISAHNDIVMMFLAILSFYYLVREKRIVSLLFLITSIAVKYATVFLLPFYLYFFFRHNKKSTQIKFALYTSLLMVLPVFFAAFRTTFQPWYLLYILVFASFGIRKSYIVIPCMIVSAFGILNYLPFIYFGVYQGLTTTLMNNINLTSLVLGIISFILFFVYEAYFKRKKS